MALGARPTDQVPKDGSCELAGVGLVRRAKPPGSKNDRSGGLAHSATGSQCSGALDPTHRSVARPLARGVGQRKSGNSENRQASDSAPKNAQEAQGRQESSQDKKKELGLAELPVGS